MLYDRTTEVFSNREPCFVFGLNFSCHCKLLEVRMSEFESTYNNNDDPS